MSNKIKHSGIVEKIESGCLKVRIVQMSACSSCSAARLCNAAEKKEKTVEVYRADDSRYKVGDAVTVTASTGTGYSAVVLAFGVPFVLLVGVTFLVFRLSGSEPWAALAGLASLVPYYACLYFFRDRLRRKFTFEIEEPFLDPPEGGN